MWTDTPLARLFCPEEEWHLLSSRSKLEQMIKAIRKAISKRQLDPLHAFDMLDANGTGRLNYNDMQRALAWMQLGFSARDYYEVVRFADPENLGFVLGFGSAFCPSFFSHPFLIPGL